MSTTILAADLGKLNSVLVWHEPSTRAATFGTVKTKPEELCRELRRQPAAQVVFEACSQAGWVHDLYEQLGVTALGVSTSVPDELWRGELHLLLERLRFLGIQTQKVVGARVVSSGRGEHFFASRSQRHGVRGPGGENMLFRAVGPVPIRPVPWRKIDPKRIQRSDLAYPRHHSEKAHQPGRGTGARQHEPASNEKQIIWPGPVQCEDTSQGLVDDGPELSPMVKVIAGCPGSSVDLSVRFYSSRVALGAVRRAFIARRPDSARSIEAHVERPQAHTVATASWPR